MPTGRHFPIEDFVRAARADPSLVGLVHTGSVGHGGGDGYSDLDFELVYEASIPTARQRALELCAALGELRFSYWRGGLATAFVGASWQRIDLHPQRKEDFAPAPSLAGARVLVDRDGSIAEVVGRSRAAAPSIEAHDARRELACAVDTQIYVALHAARGALWSAMGELTFRLAELHHVLAALRGVEAFGFRHAEAVLRANERAEFERAWPREPNVDELRRAARALWSFTRLVCAAVEAQLGAEAVPSVSEPELLAAVDAIYAR